MRGALERVYQDYKIDDISDASSLAEAALTHADEIMSEKQSNIDGKDEKCNS